MTTFDQAMTSGEVVFVVVKVDSFGPHEPAKEEDVSSWTSVRDALDEAKELRSGSPSEYRIEVREL